MDAREDRSAAPGSSGAGVSRLGGLGYQLGLVARRARACFEHELAEAGASFATWKVLELLSVRGPTIQGELAEALCIRGPTATRMLDRMAAEGLVRRSPVAADRRKAEIALTPEGERLHDRLGEAHEKANARLSAGLSAEELRTLSDLLDRVLHNATES